MILLPSFHFRGREEKTKLFHSQNQCFKNRLKTIFFNHVLIKQFPTLSFGKNFFRPWKCSQAILQTVAVVVYYTYFRLWFRAKEPWEWLVIHYQWKSRMFWPENMEKSAQFLHWLRIAVFSAQRKYEKLHLSVDICLQSKKWLNIKKELDRWQGPLLRKHPIPWAILAPKGSLMKES